MSHFLTTARVLVGLYIAFWVEQQAIAQMPDVKTGVPVLKPSTQVIKSMDNAVRNMATSAAPFVVPPVNPGAPAQGARGALGSNGTPLIPPGTQIFVDPKNKNQLIAKFPAGAPMNSPFFRCQGVSCIFPVCWFADCLEPVKGDGPKPPPGPPPQYYYAALRVYCVYSNDLYRSYGDETFTVWSKVSYDDAKQTALVNYYAKQPNACKGPDPLRIEDPYHPPEFIEVQPMSRARSTGGEDKEQGKTK